MGRARQQSRRLSVHILNHELKERMNLKWLARPFISKPIPSEALSPPILHTSPLLTAPSIQIQEPIRHILIQITTGQCLLCSSPAWGLLTSALYRPSYVPAWDRLGRFQEYHPSSLRLTTHGTVLPVPALGPFPSVDFILDP